MRIIPVMDLQGGHVVQAVAGQRSQYRPVRSVFAGDARPATVARGLVEQFGFRQVYVADLDAITGGPANQEALTAIAAAGLHLLLDAGVGSPDQARVWLSHATLAPAFAGLIVGLESLTSPGLLAPCLQAIGPERAVFSVDLKHGRPLTAVAAWRDLEAEAIAEAAIGRGFTRLILLDVARVGGGQGPGLEALCRRLRNRYPQLELIGGGGVRGIEDLQQLAAAGCDAVLVATALHRGRITRQALDKLVEYRSS
jgi:phosphoribosylformimino-5-aminoimidazole carboxamide ribotide isomerase